MGDRPTTLPAWSDDDDAQVAPDRPVDDPRSCARRLSRADPGGFRRPRLPVRLGRDPPRASHPLPDARLAPQGRLGRGPQRGAHPARDDRQRRELPPARVRGRTVRRGAAFGRDPLFPHPARRDRPRRVEQARRRPARAVPQIPLSGHDRGPAPAARRGAEGRPPAAGHGHVDGRDAHLALGRDAPGIHGRAPAAGLAADADLGPQPRVAADHRRLHPQRPVLAGRRVQGPAAQPADRVRGPVLHGEQPRRAAEGGAEPGPKPIA